MLGKRIRELRVEHHMSQTELADVLGLKSPSVVSAWETESNRLPVEYVEALCKVFGCCPNDLFNNAEFNPDRYKNAVWKLSHLDDRAQDICCGIVDMLYDKGRLASETVGFTRTAVLDHKITPSERCMLDDIKTLKARHHLPTEFLVRFLWLKGFEVSIVDMVAVLHGFKALTPAAHQALMALEE